MKPSKLLQQRFEAENFEIIDFLDEFLRWCQGTVPEVRTQLKTDFEPIRWPFIRRQLPISLMAVVSVQAFLYFVMKQPVTILGFIFNLGFTFILICLVQVGRNILARRRFLTKIQDILQTVLPRSNYVGDTQHKRIKRVSRWFLPARQFASKIPGKEGLIVVVLSPTEPKLLFIRDL